MRFLIAVAALLLSQCVAAEGHLVSTKWLEGNLNRADVLILDASPAKAYAAGHIPGAVNVDVFTILTFGIREVPMIEIERTYQSYGISPGKKIVLYDQGGTWFAPRFLYALSYHGFPVKDLTILDGGFAKWKADGLAVTKDATPAPKPGAFKVARIDESVRAKLPEFLTASGDTANNVLIEALGPEMHFGQAKFFNKAGHIPNAVLMPEADWFNADKTFKSPDEIRRMLAYYSIKPEQSIYAHCGGGGAAAIPYFALKYVMDYPKVKLYNESQMGWLNDERDLPFWTYDAPGLMRDTDWLGSWGGKMMRMYGQSNVSVVDVRPAEAYKQAHVPFALNVPAEVFRANAGNPAKLAEALGAAGVDARHEAVVVSGAGITRDSALAFLMLERMGQRKVSVFMDSLESIESLDKMSRRGFAVTKDPTTLPPTTYPGDLRKADAKGAGIYPKVFIASGASIPAKSPDGKVVHIPYTELVKPDGTPREAKDIWAILAKAGVPRYAEIVCFSDDPGEAAVNYFILKLMGFPDAKVLMT